MATAAVTYTFAAGAAVAAQMNQNFTDLVNFINTNCIQKDGSLAMTAALTLVGSDPVNDNHAARKVYVDTKASTISLSIVPIGETVWYPKTTVPASNSTITWLKADGQAVSRTTYATLFSLIGTTYGAGNGTTTFNVPNITTLNANGTWMIRGL